jgi:hypothetical protein
MSTTSAPSEQLVLWGKRHQFIQGFDPLGMQATPTATYSYLLPGITNPTNRIRYYGFYCWLLSEFADRELHKQVLPQHNYIRRAELLVACMMDQHARGTPQIAGTDRAGKLRTETTIELDRHGDHGTDSYFQGRWGSFGQNYFGAMNEMALVGRDEENLFRCTDVVGADKVHGRRLGAAFRSNLQAQAVELFFQALDSGRIQRADLEPLFGSFAIHQIPPETEEWRLYAQLLTTVDHPMAPAILRTHRARTIGLLCEAAQAVALGGPRDLLWRIYTTGWPAALAAGDTHALWYVYQLNDLWQYAALAVFNGFQNALQDETGPRAVDQVVSEYVRKVVADGLTGVGIPANHRIGAPLPADVPEEQELIALIQRGYRNGPWPDTMARGLALVLRLAERNMAYKLDQHTYAQGKGVLRSGHVYDGLEMIYRMDGRGADEFLAHFMMRWLVLRHPFEAVRKAGGGARSTLKFVVDDERIRALRHREPFPPQFTTPRLGALCNMLVDLGLLGRDANAFVPGPQAGKVQIT